MSNNSWVIGADIGGTHITAAVVDLENKCLLPGTLTRNKVDSSASQDQIIATWTEALTKAGSGLEVRRIGIAMPGPFDYDKGISLITGQAKYESLYGVNVKNLLAASLKNDEEDIAMINDAAAFIAGEAFSGAAANHDKVVGVTLGTGLGTCVFNKGNSSSADLWDLPFKAGIAEDYLSTRWFIRRYKEASGSTASGVHELSGYAHEDDEVKNIFHEFGNNLAEFLKKFLELHSAQAIVVGGNIAKSFSHFKEPLMEQLAVEFPEIKIMTALLGEEAALLGAASLWKRG